MRCRRSPRISSALSLPSPRAGGSAPHWEGAGAAGTEAIGPEPPPRPATICWGFASRAPGARAPARPAAPRPPAYLLRPAPGRPPRAAKFASPAPRPDADGTAAMFAPRLLDFQKTKYAR